MKLITAILNGNTQTYNQKVALVQDALVPFAQWAIDFDTPYYQGFAVETLDIKVNEGEYFFIMDEKLVVTYYPSEHAVSYCEGSKFGLTPEDEIPVMNLIKRLKETKADDKKEKFHQLLMQLMQQLEMEIKIIDFS